MPEEPLADELRAAGRDLDVPSPDPAAMVRAVRARLAAGTSTSPARRRMGRGWQVAAAVALGFAVLLAGSAEMRAAVVELFRFAGIVVERQHTAPSSTAPAPGSGGSTVADLDAARAAVGFPVLEPTGRGAPERVEVLDGRVVSLTYRGFRLDQFDGTLDPAFVKGIPAQDAVEWTRVGGADAVWLRGPHAIVYVGRDGTRRTETSRLAANTLVWQQGRVTVRLEGDLGVAEAVAIAETLR